MAGDAAGGLDHLEDAESLAVAEVVGQNGMIGEGFEGQDVRLGQVDDVDVVADARAVGRGVVVAEDGDGRALAEGHLQDERDEVGFGVVVLAALGRAAGCIEVAQAGVAQAVRDVQPVQHPLDRVLALAVRRAGHDRLGLGDRDPLGPVEQVGGRREDEPPDAACHSRLEHVGGKDDVVAQVLQRLLHALADERVAGEVEDAVDARVRVEQRADRRPVRQIDLDEGGRRVDGRTVALVEIVEHDDVVAGSDELGRGDAADVAGTAGDEDFHGGRLLRRSGATRWTMGGNGVRSSHAAARAQRKTRGPSLRPSRDSPQVLFGSGVIRLPWQQDRAVG